MADKWKTRRAVSSGGIVFRKKGSRTDVALIARGGKKVWCLPKGTVEKGETLEEAALREVEEETGLSGRLVEKVDEIDYWFYWKLDKTRYHKTVHFFLIEYQRGEPHSDDIEVDAVQWFPIEEAVQKLTYPNEQNTMKKVEEMVRGARA